MKSRNTIQQFVVVIVLIAFPAQVFAGFVYGGNFNTPIIDEPGPGVTMTEVTIEVLDHHIINDIDVTINITHTNVFDLQIFLQSPQTSRIYLNIYNFADRFFVGQNYTNTIFDDEAQISIEHAEAPFTGRFKPFDATGLTIFDSQDIFGTWRLQIYDMYDTDAGTLDSFELTINTPQPSTIALLILGANLMRLYKHRRHS